MTKTDALRRFLLPCFAPSSTTSSATPIKKRLSTSLRDDQPDPDPRSSSAAGQDSDPSSPTFSTISSAQPRPSKSMVIGTIFGHRRGHVWFCVQHDRLSTRPALLLELSILTHQLVKEMRFGLVRITLECDDRSDLATCPLRSVPAWALHCNGRKIGFSARRKAGDKVRLMLKAMNSTTVGAGALPAQFGFGSSDSDGPVMYMRANYEHVIGSADSESFHLINPDQFPGQELSVFLLRNLMKLMVLPGTVWWAKTLDLASRICAVVSFSSMWR
ncbi:protein MIZU-KUSSEI 1 [Argentina anserina]|uniref:protein MIZU-KUSSEI 1 n=1 Tax=Argentina anserina TaxID=57926 RepID=UPI00217625D2|nr:protein MIZU-KUSSEI 1 [Potentilla anserina]